MRVNKITALTILSIALIFSGCGKLAETYNQPGNNKEITILKRQNNQAQDWFKIKRVVDGDTFIIVPGNERVRLIGVNAPESVKPGEHPQPYGIEASRFLNNILSGQDVKLVFDVAKRDKYGRLLAYVYLRDGSFVNLIMLKEGYAQVMTVPPNVVHAREFLNIQNEARKHGKGLWGISADRVKG